MHSRSLVFLSLLVTTTLFAQGSAYVIDMDGKSVAALDLGSGKPVAKVTLPFTPDRALILPDGKSVLALYQGPGTTGFFSSEFRPKGPSQAAIIRGDKLAGSTELGWGLAQAAFSADGATAYVLTTGYESNKLPERKPSELIRIDTSNGKIADRIAFDAAALAFATDSTGKTGIVFSPPYPKKKPAPLPARVTFVDLQSFKVAEVIDLQGDVRKPVAAGDLLYVVDAGNKNKTGNLFIIDAKSRSLVKTLPLGPEAVMAGSDAQGRVVVLSQAADKKSGRVWLLKGAEIVGEYPGPEAPKFVTASSDGNRIYVAGWKDFSIIDLSAKKGSAAFELARDPFAVLATKDNSRAFVVSNDGTSCCRITTFDASGMKKLTSFLGGSKGERFGQGALAAAATVASYQSGRSAANASGASSFTYTIYTPTLRGGARGPLAFSPDEKKIYLVDTQTNDVTIVDVATGERLKNLDAGYGLREVVPLHEAGLIAAISDADVRLIDVTTDEPRETIKLSGNVVDALLTPDEKRLVIFGKQRVVVLDALTGKEIARTEAVKQPVQVLFSK